MLTFSVIQIFLSALGSVSTTLFKYHYANLVAQVFMLVFNLVPVNIARLLAVLTLGTGAVSSFFCWFLSFVRFWRYLFFPTRQNFSFFLECVFNFILITVQFVFFLYQANQLTTPRRKMNLKYNHSMVKYAVTILFFHDFFYGALFYNIGTWFEFFGVTQFIVHTLMFFVPKPSENVRIFTGFVILWGALLAQHIVTVVFTFTNSSLSGDVGLIIRWLAGVYIVTDVVYLLNSAVYFKVDPLWRCRSAIDEATDRWDGFFISRVGGKNK